MEEGDVLRQAFVVDTVGRRRSGRPKLRWKDMAERDVREDVQDREVWKTCATDSTRRWD